MQRRRGRMLAQGLGLMAAFGVVRFTTEFGIGLQMGATRRQIWSYFRKS